MLRGQSIGRRRGWRERAPRGAGGGTSAKVFCNQGRPRGLLGARAVRTPARDKVFLAEGTQGSLGTVEPASMFLRQAIRPRLPRRSDGAVGRPCCLIAALHPERGLGHALAQHLSGELPDLDFTLTDRPRLAAVWLCGYEAGHAALVRAWRTRHPRAILLATGREPTGAWAGEVLAAGADHALAWPMDLARVARLLHARHLERRA